MKFVAHLRETVRKNKPRLEAEQAARRRSWIKDQLVSIQAQCRAAAEEGYDYVVVSGELFSEVVEALEADGLSVGKSIPGRHMTTTHISWGE